MGERGVRAPIATRAEGPPAPWRIRGTLRPRKGTSFTRWRLCMCAARRGGAVGRGGRHERERREVQKGRGCALRCARAHDTREGRLVTREWRSNNARSTSITERAKLRCPGGSLSAGCACRRVSGRWRFRFRGVKARKRGTQ